MIVTNPIRASQEVTESQESEPTLIIETEDKSSMTDGQIIIVQIDGVEQEVIMLGDGANQKYVLVEPKL